MDSYVESVGMMKKFDARSSLHSLGVNISAERFLDRSLFFIKTTVEYALGMHIGFAAGWILGWYTGNVYAENFEPLHFRDLNEFWQWELVPYEFAGNGAIIGVAVGAIVIAIINNKLLKQRVIFFYKKGKTDPRDIAQALGKRVGQIERKMNKLIEKGRILSKKEKQND